MKTIAPLPDAEDDLPFKQLTADEARRLREEHPSISVWWVLGGQALVGFVTALAAWALTGKQNVGLSAGYGALAVVIPAAIFARGLSRRFAARNVGAAAVGFMVREMVKIFLSLAMLMAAPKVVTALSWPALLIGMVLAMKVYWVALAYKPRKRKLNVE